MRTTRAAILEKRKRARKQQLDLISENVPNAFAWLKSTCGDNISKLIPNEQMPSAEQRLKWELNVIQKYNLSVIFLHLYQYMEQSGIKANDILRQDRLPYSFVAYLLGLTIFNPITYGLEPEVFYGDYQKGTFAYKLPFVEFSVSREIRNNSIEILRCLPGIGEAVELGWQNQLWIAFLPNENAPKIGPIFKKENGSVCAVFYQEAKEKCWDWCIRTDDRRLEHLSRLYFRTGIQPNDINLFDEGIVSYLTENNIFITEPLSYKDLTLDSLGLGINAAHANEYREMIELFKPSCFVDFAKIEGLLHGTGTWTDKIKLLVNEGKLTLKNIFATRDDVKEYFESKGISKAKAVEISRFPQNINNFNADLQSADIDDWCREICKELQYLFPRGNTISLAWIYWQLAYFRHYHSKIFYETMLLSNVTPSNSYHYGAYEPA